MLATIKDIIIPNFGTFNCVFPIKAKSKLILYLSKTEKCNRICNDPHFRKYFIDFLCNLQVQMQTIQLKLENIRSIFQNQQAGFRNLTDKHVRPIPFVVPASDNLVRSRAPFFSPTQGRVS